MPNLRETLSALPSILSSYQQNEEEIHKAESERGGLEKDLERMENERRGELGKAQERRDSLTRDVEEARAAGVMVDQLAASLESEASLLTASRLRLKEAQEAMPPLREAKAALPGILAAYRETRSALDDLRSRQQRMLKDLGEAQAGLDRCLELEGRRQESVKALAEASLQKGVYDQLSDGLWQGWDTGASHRAGHPGAGEPGQRDSGPRQRSPDEPEAGDPEGEARRRRPQGDPGHQDIRRAGHTQLRDVQRRRGVPHQLCPAYRLVQAASASLWVRRCPRCSSTRGSGARTPLDWRSWLRL